MEIGLSWAAVSSRREILRSSPNSWLMVTFSVVLLLIMAVHFLPTARVALEKAGSWNTLIDELLRREKKRQKVKQKVVK